MDPMEDCTPVMDPMEDRTPVMDPMEDRTLVMDPKEDRTAVAVRAVLILPYCVRLCCPVTCQQAQMERSSIAVSIIYPGVIGGGRSQSDFSVGFLLILNLIHSTFLDHQGVL